MKKTYISPQLKPTDVVGDSLMFNPASNTTLPSNPVQPGVGAKEDYIFDSSDIWTTEFE
ncbi:MAG: hypothetical protein IJS59_05995 [Bacteroidaceae bacterium]|nr:hypothetical protein [Bacteroidaceae bacterium]